MAHIRFGYCLSGGGVRGMAHLGALQALEEAGIRPSMISGTSAGAMVGAFYAAGYSPRDILEITDKSKMFSTSVFHFRKAGFFSMKYFADAYKFFFPTDNFSLLKIPVSVTATDLINGKARYFTKGILSKALMASACVPMVFQPIEFEGTYYIDGGVMDNFPVEQLYGHCDKIIGIHVNASVATKKKITMSQVLDTTFNLSVNKTVYEKKGLCDLFIEPPEMLRFGMLDFKKSKEIFEVGYTFTKELLAKKELDLTH